MMKIGWTNWSHLCTIRETASVHGGHSKRLIVISNFSSDTSQRLRGLKRCKGILIYTGRLFIILSRLTDFVGTESGAWSMRFLEDFLALILKP